MPSADLLRGWDSKIYAEAKEIVKASGGREFGCLLRLADSVLRGFAVRGDEINFEFAWQVSYVECCHGTLTDQASTLEVRKVQLILCVMLVFLTVMPGTLLAPYQRDFQPSLYAKFAHVKAVEYQALSLLEGGAWGTQGELVQMKSRS